MMPGAFGNATTYNPFGINAPTTVLNTAGAASSQVPTVFAPNITALQNDSTQITSSAGVLPQLGTNSLGLDVTKRDITLELIQPGANTQLMYNTQTKIGTYNLATVTSGFVEPKQMYLEIPIVLESTKENISEWDNGYAKLDADTKDSVKLNITRFYSDAFTTLIDRESQALNIGVAHPINPYVGGITSALPTFGTQQTPYTDMSKCTKEHYNTALWLFNRYTDDDLNVKSSLFNTVLPWQGERFPQPDSKQPLEFQQDIRSVRYKKQALKVWLNNMSEHVASQYGGILSGESAFVTMAQGSIDQTGVLKEPRVQTWPLNVKVPERPRYTYMRIPLWTICPMLNTSQLIPPNTLINLTLTYTAEKFIVVANTFNGIGAEFVVYGRYPIINNVVPFRLGYNYHTYGPATVSAINANWQLQPIKWDYNIATLTDILLPDFQVNTPMRITKSLQADCPYFVGISIVPVKNYVFEAPKPVLQYSNDISGYSTCEEEKNIIPGWTFFGEPMHGWQIVKLRFIVNGSTIFDYNPIQEPNNPFNNYVKYISDWFDPIGNIATKYQTHDELAFFRERYPGAIIVPLKNFMNLTNQNIRAPSGTTNLDMEIEIRRIPYARQGFLGADVAKFGNEFTMLPKDYNRGQLTVADADGLKPYTLDPKAYRMQLIIPEHMQMMYAFDGTVATARAPTFFSKGGMVQNPMQPNIQNGMPGTSSTSNAAVQ